MASLRVRLAERRDAEALVALVKELNAHEGDPTDRFTLEVCRHDWFGRVSSPFVVLLAELDGAAVGYAVLSPDYESGWAMPGWSINDLYVREAARRRGVGRALMAAAAAEGRALSAVDGADPQPSRSRLLSPAGRRGGADRRVLTQRRGVRSHGRCGYQRLSTRVTPSPGWPT